MDATTAPESQVVEQIKEWRLVAGQKTVQGAQDVQDRLLDLYSSVKGSSAARPVEEYLSLTRERSLFDAEEITNLLDEIETGLTAN